jgi:hypothetical protein
MQLLFVNPERAERRHIRREKGKGRKVRVRGREIVRESGRETEGEEEAIQRGKGAGECL